MTRYCRCMIACWVVAAMPCVGSKLIAQEKPDTVWLEPSKADSRRDAWYPGAIAKTVGKIQSFDHKAMKIIVDGESSETAFAAHRVLWIEPGAVSKQERELDSLVAEKKHPAAWQANFRDLIKDERIPTWRKQLAWMKFSNLCFRISDHRSAIQMSGEFGGPLTPLALAWLPVAWTRDHPIPREAAYRGEDFPENSIQSQLIHISWQVQTFGRERANAAIDRIVADDSRPYIQQLAESLRGRLATPPEVLANAEELEAKLDALPMVLQVGPTLMLIEKFEAAGLKERAERLKLSLRLTPPFPHPDLPIN